MYLNKVEGKNEICWTMDYSTPKELYLKPFSGIMYTMMNFFITQDYQNGLDALNKISCP
jgi:hypothetical protein